MLHRPDACALGIENTSWAIIDVILQELVPTDEIWVYGSRAKGKARKYSDLDLFIRSKDVLPNRILAKLRERFEDSNLPFKVDITPWTDFSDDFQALIEKDARRIR